MWSEEQLACSLHLLVYMDAEQFSRQQPFIMLTSLVRANKPEHEYRSRNQSRSAYPWLSLSLFLPFPSPSPCCSMEGLSCYITISLWISPFLWPVLQCSAQPIRQQRSQCGPANPEPAFAGNMKPLGEGNNKSLSLQTNVKCLCRLFLFLILLLQEWRACCFFHVSLSSNFNYTFVLHQRLREQSDSAYCIWSWKSANLLAIQIYSSAVNIDDMLENFKQLERSLTPHAVP